MTKRSDMASRYAAAHARREQRRKQAGSREYLPLADEPSGTPQTSMAASAPAGGRGAAVAAGYRVAGVNYSYLRGDLTRTLVLAVILFAVMIVLSLVIHV